MKKKLIIVGVIVAIVAIFIGFDLKQYLDIDLLQTWVKEEPLQAGAAFFLLYLTIASLSLPGAGPLSVIAGVVFGFWYGIAIVSFASTIGATIAMILSRTLLQDWVQKRFSGVFEKVNKGVQKDGALYLFSLRLIPPIPFFVVNLVFGLTKMRPIIFYIVSQLGMLPATILYVNAGYSLGKVENISFFEIFTPEIVLSFVALLAFPIIVKFIMKHTRLANQSTETDAQ